MQEPYLLLIGFDAVVNSFLFGLEKLEVLVLAVSSRGVLFLSGFQKSEKNGRSLEWISPEMGMKPRVKPRPGRCVFLDILISTHFFVAATEYSGLCG